MHLLQFLQCLVRIGIYTLIISTITYHCKYYNIFFPNNILVFVFKINYPIIDLRSGSSPLLEVPQLDSLLRVSIIFIGY